MFSFVCVTTTLLVKSSCHETRVLRAVSMVSRSREESSHERPSHVTGKIYKFTTVVALIICDVQSIAKEATDRSMPRVLQGISLPPSAVVRCAILNEPLFSDVSDGRGPRGLGRHGSVARRKTELFPIENRTFTRPHHRAYRRRAHQGAILPSALFRSLCVRGRELGGGIRRFSNMSYVVPYQLRRPTTYLS